LEKLLVRVVCEIRTSFTSFTFFTGMFLSRSGVHRERNTRIEKKEKKEKK